MFHSKLVRRVLLASVIVALVMTVFGDKILLSAFEWEKKTFEDRVAVLERKLGRASRLGTSVLESDSPIVRETWAAALRHANAPANWLPPTEVVLIDLPHPELWGEYFIWPNVSTVGGIGFKEQIILFCPNSNETLVRNVLAHEMLHVIHMRLKVINPAVYGEIDDEAFVGALGATPRDPTAAPIWPDMR